MRNADSEAGFERAPIYRFTASTYKLIGVPRIGASGHGNNPFNLQASATRLIAIVYAAVR